ncbi:DUF3145 family protein [Saccharopolyspora griseoalba]|uniref:DUF3145 family protein n=1 Tax=Saccharopolyspora griseoalba TaxID=1431848 RepID=A0ABW2LR92_9PSEU
MDRTYGSAVIHACPPGRAGVIARILLEDFRLTVDPVQGDELPDGDDRWVVRVGECYYASEWSVGTAEELANELVQAAPDATFTVHEDPAYEFLGEMFSYVPVMGIFNSDCDQFGEPHFSLSALLALDRESAEVRRRKLGVPWREAIAALPPCTVFEPSW